MALDLKLNVSTENDCETLVITDVTNPMSSANLTGWGGSNLSPSLLQYNFILTIIYPVTVGDDLIPIPINFNLTNDSWEESNFWEFESPNIISNFIFKIDITAFLPLLNSYLDANGILNAEQELLQIDESIFIDSIYEVKMTITNTDNEILTNFSFCFSNTCTMAEQVSLMYSSTDIFCKNCDALDLEKALLAESLLHTLKNSCN